MQIFYTTLCNNIMFLWKHVATCCSPLVCLGCCYNCTILIYSKRCVVETWQDIQVPHLSYHSHSVTVQCFQTLVDPESTVHCQREFIYLFIITIIIIYYLLFFFLGFV